MVRPIHAGCLLGHALRHGGLGWDSIVKSNPERTATAGPEVDQLQEWTTCDIFLQDNVTSYGNKTRIYKITSLSKPFC